MKREDNFDVDERLKKFGRSSGYWYCNKCNYEMTSFLYNWEYHIPEKCPTCKEGDMVENEKKREAPTKPPAFKTDKEKRWLETSSITEQAEVLLDENKNPY